MLTTTGPVHPSDARLRRAQVLAHQSGAALEIARGLIDQKLVTQQKLVQDGLCNQRAAEEISHAREALATAKSIETIRLIESRGASAYWSSWRTLSINFPKKDLRRVPDHWRTFGTRFSPLTGSPRLAANPPNAMLNYLYAVLESETRLAVAALGLDPSLGVLHTDSPARDSLACDVMEPIRPQVDAYVLNWITRETLRRDWFFEQRDGSCRLMGPFAARLSETAATWSRAVAPIAESVARSLWSTTTRSRRHVAPPTRLTQDHRREARGIQTSQPRTAPPLPDSFCKNCGAEIGRGHTHCAHCALQLNTAVLIKAAQFGRVAAQSDHAQRLRAETQRRHATAKASWNPSDLPVWLNEATYRREIQPRLKEIPLSVLAPTLAISIPYAVDIRKGRRVPHSRHWKTLAELVNLTPNT